MLRECTSSKIIRTFSKFAKPFQTSCRYLNTDTGEKNTGARPDEISLSQKAVELPRSQIREIFTIAIEKEAKGEKVLNLGVGQPDFPSPPHAVKAAVSALEQGGVMTQYVHGAGIASLRGTIAQFYNERSNNHPTVPEHITVTVGSMMAFSSALMAVLDPGDECLVPDPGFPNYEMMIKLMSASPVRYTLKKENNFFPDLDELESLISSKTKMIMINSPSNPTGAVFCKETMQALASFAVRHNIFILSDEIYSDIIFHPADTTDKPTNIQSSATNQNPNPTHAPSILDVTHDQSKTMLVSGVSKNFSMTGFRVGWLRASKEITEIVTKMQEPLTSCVSPFSQAAAEAALRDPCTKDYVAHMSSTFADRARAALRVLADNGLEGRAVEPKGAFYMLVTLQGDGARDSLEFAKSLLREKGVAVAPGSAFGSCAGGAIRLSFAQSIEDVVEATQRLCDFIHSQKC